MRMSALAIVVIVCAIGLAQQTQPADRVAAHFASFQQRWGLLSKQGFKYEAKSSYATFLQRDFSKGPPPVWGKIHQYDKPHALSTSAKVELHGDEFDLVMIYEDGNVRNQHFDRDHITSFGPDQDSDIVQDRTHNNEESAFRDPVFVPDYVWREWLAYPWPETYSQDKKFGVQILKDTPELVVDVTAKWVNRGDPKTYSSVRRNVLRRQGDLGLLPTHVQHRASDGKLLREMMFEWSKVDAKDGPIPIPSKFTFRDYLVDPETGSEVLNSESGYTIDMATFRLAGQ
jgi:hypothetical protein